MNLGCSEPPCSASWAGDLMALSVGRGLFAGGWGQRPLPCLVIAWRPWYAEHSRLRHPCEPRSLLPPGGSMLVLIHILAETLLWEAFGPLEGLSSATDAACLLRGPEYLPSLIRCVPIVSTLPDSQQQSGDCNGFLCWYHIGIYQSIFPHSSVSKESAFKAGDPGLIPGLRRSLGEGNGNPLQYSCLENPMDGGAWKARVHRVTRVRHNSATKPPPIIDVPGTVLRILYLTLHLSSPPTIISAS